MNFKNGLKLLLAIVAVFLLSYLSMDPIKDNVNLGLDLQGGAYVVLQAVPDEGTVITDDDMEKLKAVMRKRVDEFGVSEPILQREGKDRIILQLAGVDNPDQAIEILGKTAKLEFKDPAGKLILTGAELKNAQAYIDPDTGDGAISLEFNNEGAEKFASATARLVGQPIIIYLDGNILQSPVVNEPIMNGEASITGGFSFEEAADHAALLRAGALPVNIEVMEKRTVGPTLGQDSLNKSIVAVVCGILIVFLFMMIYYRLPGFIASVSLILYGLIVLAVLVGIKATITLPGIAGFILSLGMAVDANIIIYERVKEELRSGKSLRAGIDSGFKRAFWTIIDANVTTLIAAAVLYQFGTGPIKGFAVTLSIGIIASVLVAITYTKFLMLTSAKINFLSKKKIFGA